MSRGSQSRELDLPPHPPRWRSFVPRWLRSFIWVDSASRYDAFLSYPWSADKIVAEQVQSVLQGFLRPWYRSRAKTVFRDLSCLPATSDLEDELCRRLDASEHLIVLASPKAAVSRGMEVEAKHWFSGSRPRGEVLIIVTDGDSQSWNDIRATALPATLRTQLTREPVFASIAHRRAQLHDAADSKVGGELVEDLKQVLLRLHPGRNWGELRGEERKQRRRVVTLLSVFSVVLMLLTAAALWQAIEARAAAARARARELTAYASLSQVEDPALALYLGYKVAAGPPPPGLESVLATALTNGASYGVLHEESGVRSVAWSPDGRTLASGREDGAIRLSEAGSGKQPRSLEGHRTAVRGVAWSPDGKTLASAGEDRTVRLWDAGAGRILKVLQGHEHPVSCVAWSSDGKRLATASENNEKDDDTIRIWDADSGRTLRILQGDLRAIRSVAWSPDGKIASAISDGTIRIWDADSGRSLHKLEGHQSGVDAVAWSPDGKFLASGSGDHTIRLWEAATGREVLWRHSTPTGQPLLALQGHDLAVWGIAWSPDGRTLASASLDRTVRLWEMPSGRLLRILRGHHAPVRSVAWSPDGKTLASAGDDRSIRFWEPASHQALRTLSQAARSLALSPDGARLAVADEIEDTLRVLATETMEPLYTIREYVADVEWSPDGKTLATAGDPTIWLWDAATGQSLRPLQGGRQTEVTRVAWSPDGEMLASSGSDGTIQLWRAAGGQPIRTLDGHREAVRSLAWSPDGKKLASAGADRAIRLWDAATGQPLRVLQGHERGVVGVMWNADGKTLASASLDGAIRFWDATTGQLLRSVPSDQRTVWSLVGGGDVLASGGLDGTIRLWRAADGEPLRTLQGHELSVEKLAWSRNGRMLASAGIGTVRLWPGNFGRLLEHVRHVIRTFTPSPAECQRYLGENTCPPITAVR